MKRQRQGLNGYNVLHDEDPRSVKQHHWESEAKEDNQLSPGGKSNRRRKLRSQPTKMNSFRSGHHLGTEHSK